MLKKSYNMTINTKIIILQLLLFSFGTMCGLTWEAYSYSKKWDKLVCSGLVVNDSHLYRGSEEKVKALINSEYIDPLMSKRIKIVAGNQSYSLQVSKAVKRYSIESKFDKLDEINEQPTMYEKIKLIKSGVKHLYKVSFTYDEKYLRSFVDDISKQTDKKYENANVVKDGFVKSNINQGTKGLKFEKDKLEEEIKNEIKNNHTKDIIIKAHTVTYAAPITSDKISSINTKIASFVTDFSASTEGRCTNIELSSKSINGKLIMPGESFSFNDVVGERTAKRGYKTATVLEDGTIASGVGGGICQVSSTLYNAILRAGIKPVEREHHSIPSTYVKLGLDATINWKDIDLKFKNTLKYPIYIEAYTKNKNLYISLYSDSRLLKRKYSISSDVYKVIHYGTKTIADANLSKGKKVLLKSGHNGYRVKVMMNTYEGNRLIKSELVSDDVYDAIPKVEKIGVR